MNQTQDENPNDFIFDDDTDFEDFKKACNWCNQTVKLEDNKPYCGKCSRNCYKECRRCHRPFPHERFFTKDENRCNTCQDKYLKEREKRIKKRELQLKETGNKRNTAETGNKHATTSVIQPSEESTDDDNNHGGGFHSDLAKEKQLAENEDCVKKKRVKMSDLINRQKTSPSRKKPRMCSSNLRSENVKEKIIYTTKK